MKFRFNKEGNTIYKELNGFEFGTINTNRSKPRFYLQTQGSTSNITLPIKFVHQLQNLYFALTGEELETKQDTTPTQRAALDENFDQTQTTQYCICDFVMVERNPNTDEARCFTCKKQIKEPKP